MVKKFFERPGRTLNPAWIILFFILLSSIVLFFHIPEEITAFLGLSFFFILAVLHPLNGIAFMLLAIPFFLGAAHNPYFSLFEILVYGTLILGFLRLSQGKNPIEIPFKPLVLLIFLAALFSIPINAKEYYWTFWATPAREIWFQWMRGHEKFPLIHLRILSNLFSGVLLFVLVANLFPKNTNADWVKLFKSMIGMGVLICWIGILFLFQIIPLQPKTYLSLSLAGTHEGAISALAFNRQYLAQYLLILFPFIFYFLFFNRKKRPCISLYLLILGLFIFSLSASMQRSVFLVLFLELFFLIGFHTKYVSNRKKTALFFFLIPFFLLAGMFLLDFLFLNKRFLGRIILIGLSDPDQRRVHLWNTAWMMFQHSPFLGVGLGKYFEFFPEFFADPHIPWKTFGLVRGEPHSFFFQILAEQGAIGLLLILTLVGAIIYRLMKKADKEPVSEQKMLLGVLAVSLISWLILGFFHNVAYIRSLGILFWVLLGCSAGLTRSPTLPKKGTNLIFFIGLLVLTAALGYQIKLIRDRSISPFFQAGFYDMETLPGGDKIRWTGKRAVENMDIQGEKKVISISAPFPGIAGHPQHVRFWVGGRMEEVILRDTEWQRISFPAEKLYTGRMLLRIETGYTFNPKKAKVSDDDRELGIMIREN
jgi:O-antigen ligase